MKTSHVGVVGLGLLGRGIAACLLAHRVPVMAYAPTLTEFVHAREAIAIAIDELIEHAGFDPSLCETWRNLYTEAESIAWFAPCDFVIESITEDVEAKIGLFRQLEEVLAAGTPIASNTSSIPITLLQRTCKYPERVLGMHWSEPAYGTRFLELIRGEVTNDASLSAASELARRVEKDPCIVQQDLPGFIANRLGYAMYREACSLLAGGVGDAETIDRAFRNSVGLWASIFGPFQWIDLTGGPALYGKAMTNVLPALSNAAEIPEPLATMMQQGYTGVRDGRGFYVYTPESAQRIEKTYRDHIWRVREAVNAAYPPDTKDE